MIKQYHFQLEKFQGPLDLLLKFIEEERLKITDISLAKVADQYLFYIENHTVNPEQLSDFLVIAARLLLLKSKEILPDLELETEEEEDIAELKQKLEIYQKYKLLARELHKLEKRGEYSLIRNIWFSRKICFSPPLQGFQVNNLANIYVNIIEQFSEEEGLLTKGTLRKGISLQEKISLIKICLKNRMELTLANLNKTGDRLEQIVNFLALLELLHRKEVVAEQREAFAEIQIRKA